MFLLLLWLLKLLFTIKQVWEAYRIALIVLKLRGLAVSTGVIGLLGLGGWFALSNIYGIQLQQEAQVSSFAAAIDEIRRQQVGDSPEIRSPAHVKRVKWTMRCLPLWLFRTTLTV